MSEALLGPIPAPKPVKKPSLTKQPLHQRGKYHHSPLAKETLAQGLQTEIPQDNIGFKLLAKMGFKPGQSLGQSSQEGLLTPLPITLKSDKKGLGESVDELVTLGKRARSPLPNEIIQENPHQKQKYRSTLTAKFDQKRDLGDIAKARKIVEQMDLIAEREQNEFWPVRSTQDELGEWVRPELTEFELMEPRIQLNQLILYLRTQYRYCLYCGCAFESDKEMDEACPGDQRGDHDD